MSREARSDFQKAGEEKEMSLVAEFWAMLKTNKKFWLIPMIAGLLVMGALILLGSTSAAPFIYSLF